MFHLLPWVESHGLHANGLRRVESTGLFGPKLHESGVKLCFTSEIYMKQNIFEQQEFVDHILKCVALFSESVFCIKGFIQKAHAGVSLFLFHIPIRAEASG